MKQEPTMYREGPPYQRRGSLQLWQFLVTLLDDPANAHFIAWTGRGMEFKLIEPEEVSTGCWFLICWCLFLFSSPSSLYYCVRYALLIQILAWPMGLTVRFLLMGQAKFSTAKYVKSISNPSANSGEGGHKDLHSKRVCFLSWKVFQVFFQWYQLFWCKPSYDTSPVSEIMWTDCKTFLVL